MKAFHLGPRGLSERNAGRRVHGVGAGSGVAGTGAGALGV